MAACRAAMPCCFGETEHPVDEPCPSLSFPFSTDQEADAPRAFASQTGGESLNRVTGHRFALCHWAKRRGKGFDRLSAVQIGLGFRGDVLFDFLLCKHVVIQVCVGCSTSNAYMQRLLCKVIFLL
jgi:hypothetical protein